MTGSLSGVAYLCLNQLGFSRQVGGFTTSEVTIDEADLFRYLDNIKHLLERRATVAGVTPAPFKWVRNGRKVYAFLNPYVTDSENGRVFQRRNVAMWHKPDENGKMCYGLYPIALPWLVYRIKLNRQSP